MNAARPGRLEWRIWKMLGAIRGFHDVAIDDRVMLRVRSGAEHRASYVISATAYYPIADLVMQESAEP